MALMIIVVMAFEVFYAKLNQLTAIRVALI